MPEICDLQAALYALLVTSPVWEETSHPAYLEARDLARSLLAPLLCVDAKDYEAFARAVLAAGFDDAMLAPL